jgi:hypothetical protein
MNQSIIIGRLRRRFIDARCVDLGYASADFQEDFDGAAVRQSSPAASIRVLLVQKEAKTNEPISRAYERAESDHVV